MGSSQRDLTPKGFRLVSSMPAVQALRLATFHTFRGSELDFGRVECSSSHDFSGDLFYLFSHDL